jgi:hypothetical protein
MNTQDLIRKRPIGTPQHHPRHRLLARAGWLVDYWAFAAGLATGATLAHNLTTH